MSQNISNTTQYRDTHNESIVTDDGDEHENELEQTFDEDEHTLNVAPTTADIQQVQQIIHAHLHLPGSSNQGTTNVDPHNPRLPTHQTTTPLQTNVNAQTNDLNQTVQNQIHNKNNKMEELAKQLKTLQITDGNPQVRYLQHDEQITKIQNLEIAENQTKAEIKDVLKTVLDLILHRDEDAIKEYMNKLENEKAEHIERSKSIVQGVSAANKVAKKYKTSLATPLFTEAPERVTLNPQRTSPREIITVTGKFNPHEHKADFNQMWNKLTSYGQLNYFTEEDYITALTYILEGDAYEALTSMTEESQSLQYIINYFAKVYGRKRSINKDRTAVDNFTRFKDEPLEICMHRSLIAIDRLRHLHSPEAWPEIRDIFRRNILTQMISEKTKRHIQIEENKILEKTGLHIDIDKLIDIAQEFELFHGEIPHKDVSTIFKAASGGFTEDITGMRNELQHFKKSKNEQKNQITEIVQDLITNPARIYKNEGKTDIQKERRRFDSSSAQRNARQNSFDRARDIPKETQTTPTHVTYRRPESTPRPPSLQRHDTRPFRSPSPYSPPKLTQNNQTFTSPYRQGRDENRNTNGNKYPRYQRYNRSQSGSRTDPRRSDRYRSTSRQRQQSFERRNYSNDNRGRSNSRSNNSNRYRTDSTFRYRNRSNESRRPSRDRDYRRSAENTGFNRSVLVHINKAEPENGMNPSHH